MKYDERTADITRQRLCDEPFKKDLIHSLTDRRSMAEGARFVQNLLTG